MLFHQNALTSDLESKPEKVAEAGAVNGYSFSVAEAVTINGQSSSTTSASPQLFWQKPSHPTLPQVSDIGFSPSTANMVETVTASCYNAASVTAAAATVAEAVTFNCCNAQRHHATTHPNHLGPLPFENDDCLSVTVVFESGDSDIEPTGEAMRDLRLFRVEDPVRANDTSADSKGFCSCACG